MLSDLWSELDAVHAERFEVELAREVAEGHPLVGEQVRAVAVRKLEKEVIFWLPAERSWVRVHLTWAKEASPNFPRLDVHDTWASPVSALRDAGRE
jgi:prephenate dehydrogenase